MNFGVSADQTEKDVDYEIHDENFFVDFVEFSRDNQVLNEEQASVVEMAMGTGFMDDFEYYTSIIVTGGSSSGKSHMLDNVNMASLEYAQDMDDLLYEMTGSSDQGGINDDEMDEARVAYFHELQKIPDEMLEFIKTVSEDGKFIYGRSTADSDADGGFSTDKFTRDPLVVVFSFADENQAAAGKDQELRTRTVEVKVDESEDKNEAVHDMKWGGEEITLPSSEHEYIHNDQQAQDRAHAVKAHIRDAPTDVDVVIPYGNGKFEGDDWKAADVVRPMFSFARSESTRASANLAGLTMGSAMLNYHARDTVCEACGERYGPEESQTADYECPNCGEDLFIIANETDVGNVIACRETLLTVTHGLDDKKFAVLDAIRERGGQASADGTAVQATKRDIIEEIQENDAIATLTKSEIEGILDELDENLIINKKDNPEDRRENLYVYDGSAVFKAPNIFDYYDRFEDVTDPIRDQPIEETIAEQQESFNAKMEMGSMASADAAETAESGLERFEDGDSDSYGDLDETAERVAERLTETVDGYTIPADVVEDNSLKLEHMLGVSPVEYDDGYVTPEREPRGDDKVEGVMSPDEWDEYDSFKPLEEALTEAVTTLREENILQMDEQPSGDVEVSVQ